VFSIGEVRTGLRWTQEKHECPAEMTDPALHLAALATLTLGVGVIMVRLGLNRGLLEPSKPQRRCPACGRLIRTRLCPLCAGKTRRHLKPPRARKRAA
jgi:rRNA maturation endonuclease Nob1